MNEHCHDQCWNRVGFCGPGPVKTKFRPVFKVEMYDETCKILQKGPVRKKVRPGPGPGPVLPKIVDPGPSRARPGSNTDRIIDFSIDSFWLTSKNRPTCIDLGSMSEDRLTEMLFIHREMTSSQFEVDGGRPNHWLCHTKILSETGQAVAIYKMRVYQYTWTGIIH